MKNQESILCCNIDECIQILESRHKQVEMIVVLQLFSNDVNKISATYLIYLGVILLLTACKLYSMKCNLAHLLCKPPTFSRIYFVQTSNLFLYASTRTPTPSFSSQSYWESWSRYSCETAQQKGRHSCGFADGHYRPLNSSAESPKSCVPSELAWVWAKS